MTFGEKLQNLRKRTGMSQDALAEKLEVSRQAVSKWERDEAMPETEKVVRIAKLFGVSLDELLMDKNDEPEPQPRFEPPRYQPRRPTPEERLRQALKQHGYKLGYILMAIGALICVCAIVMRLVWPGLAGNFFDAAQPDFFGNTGWEIQFEGDVPDSVKQEITEQLMGDSFGGFYGSAFEEMDGMMDNAVNAQANLFLIPLLPGLLLIVAGLILVIKGKKWAAQEI